MRKFFLFLVLFLCLFKSVIFSYDLSVPNPTYQFYVNDFANIIKRETKEKIISISEKIDREKDGIQIVVATLESLEGMDISDFALEMFRKYKIGKLDKGVLFLTSIHEKKVRIEVGYHLEEVLNDAKVGEILDNYVVPYFKKGDFDRGILEGYKAIAKKFVKLDESEQKEYSDNYGVSSIVFFAILMIILFFSRGSGGPGNFLGGFLLGNFLNSGTGFGGSKGRNNTGFGGSSGGGGADRDF